MYGPIPFLTLAGAFAGIFGIALIVGLVKICAFLDEKQHPWPD